MLPLQTVHPEYREQQQAAITDVLPPLQMGRTEVEMDTLLECSGAVKFSYSRVRLHMVLALQCIEKIVQDYYGASPPPVVESALCHIDAMSEEPWDREPRRAFQQDRRIYTPPFVGSQGLSRILHDGILSHQSLSVRSALVLCLSFDTLVQRRVSRAHTSRERIAVYDSIIEEFRLMLKDLFCIPMVWPADESIQAWNGGCIPAMAEDMYENGDFTCMPILADALEEAGCVNREMIDHCRSDIPHQRGCAVVDALLGKR